MVANLIHIYRNTPLGRETLMQSVYFCKKLNVGLSVYIPDTVRFMMKFADDAIQVDLDRSYLTDPKTALERVRSQVSKMELKPEFLVPANLASCSLPVVPTDFQFMCCPRGISDLSSKIGLGYIGPTVRRIVQSARFPVLITSPAFKAWKSVAVLFGGSDNALNALRTGIQISKRTGCPLDLFIHLEQAPSYYLDRIRQSGLEKQLEDQVRHWHCFETGEFAENLYTVPHDAIVLVGAYDHKSIRHVLFGSKLETIQATLANCLLVCGPRSMAILTELNTRRKVSSNETFPNYPAQGGILRNGL
jgi:hypothetical protein